MHLYLPDTPTFVLTVKTNSARKARLQAMLLHYGFSDIRWIDGPITRNHNVGARVSAIRTLASLRVPALWLEDDAAILPAYRPSIYVPDDAQVAYLGGSPCGSPVAARRGMGARNANRPDGIVRMCRVRDGIPNARQLNRSALYMDTEHDEWVRILSMFSGHAILWIDDAARVAMFRALRASKGSYDRTFSAIQWRYKVYGLRHPWFCQLGKRYTVDYL